MDEKKLLTIIIPLYKGKAYIKETVEKILEIKASKQILIIDDGSPDDSYEYCVELFKNNEEVEIFKKKNGGIADARNYGLAKSKGEYIIFVDQDDIVVPTVIDSAIEIAQCDNLEMVLWSADRIFESGDTTPCDIVYEYRKLDRKEIHEKMFSDMILNIDNSYVSYIGHVWNVLYQTKFLRDWKIKFKTFVSIEDDYLFVLDCLAHATKMVCMPDVGYYWTYNTKSESNRLKYIDTLFSRYEKMYRYILNVMDEVGVDKNLRDRYILFIKQDAIIRTIENCFTCLNDSKEEKREVIKVINQYKNVFKTEFVRKYDKRPKRLFYLLRYNLVPIATSYVYLDSIYRKLRKKLN